MKGISTVVLSLSILTGSVNICFARLPIDFVSNYNSSVCTKCDSNLSLSALTADDYQTDIQRLIALRSHPLDELLAQASQLESRWRRKNWDHYARVMIYVCSEIANRGLNDTRVREQTQHFARVALSHSKMFDWEHQSSLVGWFSYERWSSTDTVWLSERREKTQLWLQAWRRLETEIDLSFDINDRKNRPRSRIFPPDPLLPVGSPPSAVKDPKLRAQYVKAIAENKRKSEKMLKQFPLQTRGPFFKARAERVLIKLYSQPPFRNAELRRYLELYMHDANARQRILDEVQKSHK